MEQAKRDYLELLRETRYVNYQVSAETRGQAVKMREIEESLEQDRRHQVLGFMAEERRQMLQDYLDELQSKMKMEVEKRSKIEEGVLKDH